MPQPKEEEGEPVVQRKQWRDTLQGYEQQFKAEYAAMLDLELGNG